VLERWLDLSLMECLRISEELCEEERVFRLEAARLAVRELAPEGSGLEERMQAVAYVCAHAGGLDYQARANSRFLGLEERAAAQGFAGRLLGLAGRLAAGIARLRAEREKAGEAARVRAKAAVLERRFEAQERVRARGNIYPSPEDLAAEEARILSEEAEAAAASGQGDGGP